MKSQSESNDTLRCFFKDIAVPVPLAMYVHMDQMNSKTKKFCHQVGTTLCILEAGTMWSNLSELYTGLFKEAVCRKLCMTDAPMILWDYCMELQSQIHNTVPRPFFSKSRYDSP